MLRLSSQMCSTHAFALLRNRRVMVIAGSFRSEASFKGGPGGLWAGAAWVPWCRPRCRYVPLPAVLFLRQIAKLASRKRPSGVS